MAKIQYKWATLGTGVIANELAETMSALGGQLYSVANRTYDKGLAFAEKYEIEKSFKQFLTEKISRHNIPSQMIDQIRSSILGKADR